jgi:hypothetical protein
VIVLTGCNLASVGGGSESGASNEVSNYNPPPSTPQPGTDLFRIGDCQADPRWGFCFDIVKIDSIKGCTKVLTPFEWQLPHYSRSRCLQPDGSGCRVARICQWYQDKGQCIASVPHHDNVPKCPAPSNKPPSNKPPANQPPSNPPPPNPPPSGSCKNVGDCGSGICYWNGTCVPRHSKPLGASCRMVNGNFNPDLCQVGLTCKIATDKAGKTYSQCAKL